MKSKNERDLPGAEIALIDSIKLRKISNDSTGLAHSYSTIGNLYRRQKDYPKAEDAYRKSLKEELKLDNKTGVGKVKHGLATILLEQKGEKDKTLKLLNESIQIFKDLNDNRSLGFVYNTLAKFYIKYDKHDEVQSLLESAIKMIPKGNNHLLATLYLSLGRFLSQHTEQSDKADIAFRKTIELEKSDKNNYGQAMTWYAFGLHKIKLNQFDLATEYLKNALKIEKRKYMISKIKNRLREIDNKR